MTRIFACLALFALLWTPGLTWAANVSMDVERTQIADNESLTVTWIYRGDLKNKPAFEALEADFEILGQQPRSDLQVINGIYNYELTWVLTLMPKRVGELVIPAIDFDGELSPAVTITVSEAQSSDVDLGDLYLEAELTPADGVVQQQFVFTQRLFHRGYLTGGDLSEPNVGDQNVVLRKIDRIRRYSIFRAGNRYQVHEQSYLVFPQAPGTLRIGTSGFTGQLNEPRRQPRLKRVSAPAVEAAVASLPPAYGAGAFLPAASVMLEERWPQEPQQLIAGEPVTREITVTAVGLPAAQIPDLPEVEAGASLRLYPDRTERSDRFAQDGVVGTLRQAIAIVPREPGEVTLPAVEIKWWDTAANETRVARLPERRFSVVAAAGLDDPLTTDPQTAGAEGPATAPLLWPAVAAGFAGLWLLTLLAWWRKRPPPAVEELATAARPDAAATKTSHDLRRACEKGDASAARQAVLAMARGHWPDDPPLNLDEVSARVSPEFAAELARLNAATFSAAAAWTEPNRLWRFSGELRGRHKTRRGRHAAQALPAL